MVRDDQPIPPSFMGKTILVVDGTSPDFWGIVPTASRHIDDMLKAVESLTVSGNAIERDLNHPRFRLNQAPRSPKPSSFRKR